MRKLAYSAFILFLVFNGCGSLSSLSNRAGDNKQKLPYLTQFDTDTLFNSHQFISLFIVPNESMKQYKIEFASSGHDLLKTSSIAERNNAVAAVNGVFFDRDHGGSVSYFELNDSVVSTTRSATLKWAKPDSLANGAIVLTKNSTVEIEPAGADRFYEDSKQELAVMVSGPLLIQDSVATKLPNVSFTNERHPRTCVCTSRDALILVAVDGRSKNAEGMSLVEAQRFLLTLGCVNAINLDGGGSTTLWLREKGVVNHPSDDTGERPVANAILIIGK